MSSGIWYVAQQGRQREPSTVIPTPPPALDYTWLDEMLEQYHTPAQTYNGDPAHSGQMPLPTSHAEQMNVYRTVYEAETATPWRDGLVYYDPSSVTMHAYYYLQARGNPADSRWIDASDDGGTFWHLANTRNAYGSGTGVYHFPAGLWLCQGEGVALDNAQFIADCENAIRTFYGSFYYSNGTSHERVARETGRLFEWLLFYYREIGQTHPNYKNDVNHYGARYHNGQSWQEHHLWEWLDEWTEAPAYPRYGGGSFTDPRDYMALGIDPNSSLGLALFNMGPFWCQFAVQANIQLWEEDANYKTTQRAEFIRRMVDYNWIEGWFPASGTPGNVDEYGAWGYFYCQCGPPDGVRVPHTFCTSATNTDWGERFGPSRELSGFHLQHLAWLWRYTGDDVWRQRFDENWQALKDMYNNGHFNYFMHDYRGGKQFNQILLRIFDAIVLRGEYSFKTASYPTGGWPFPTPPATDPNP